MNNDMITVPKAYVKAVDELLNLQQRYFAKSAEAKRSKAGALFQEAKDILRECKEAEYKLRAETSRYMTQIYGSMTPEEAIRQMKLNLEAKEVHHG